jgi:hypothetical protein
VDSEEQRKDSICMFPPSSLSADFSPFLTPPLTAAMDGISMIVECLLQSKSTDKELYQSGRAFLQAFASNEQRAQFVVDCGGGYIL